MSLSNASSIILDSSPPWSKSVAVTGTGATTGQRVLENPNDGKSSVSNDGVTPLRTPVLVTSVRIVKTSVATTPATRIELYDIADGASTSSTSGLTPVCVLEAPITKGGERKTNEGEEFVFQNGIYALTLTDGDANSTEAVQVTITYYPIRHGGNI